LQLEILNPSDDHTIFAWTIAYTKLDGQGERKNKKGQNSEVGENRSVVCVFLGMFGT